MIIFFLDTSFLLIIDLRKDQNIFFFLSNLMAKFIQSKNFHQKFIIRNFMLYSYSILQHILTYKTSLVRNMNH